MARSSAWGGRPSARLLTIWPQGFYEVNLQLGGSFRRSLLPISRTFILAAEPELEREPLIEIER